MVDFLDWKIDWDNPEEAEKDILYKAELRHEATILRVLQGYIHTDINENEIDVREIDSDYAVNLHNWYLGLFKHYQEEARKSPMVMKLKEIGGITYDK